jgi:methylmalonyl-CoA/ethylmalonyl-CoA epimerase
MSPVPFNLHHVGILVKDIEAESANLGARFGYVVESPIIEDEVQTALVRFLRQPGAACWCELISPNGPGSKLAQALEQGGGLHHVCYEVDDMAAACAHLSATAMMMFRKPTPAVAFGGRPIAWFLGRNCQLVELVSSGDGPLSLAVIRKI